MGRRTWGGPITFTALVGGRHGGYVRVGDAAVPRRMQLEMDGTGGTPDLRMRFEIRDDRPECVELTVSAKHNGRGILATDLQVLQRRLGALTAEAFAQLAAKPFHRQRDGALAGAYGRVPDDRRRQVERDLYELRSSRRADVPRAELEQVAEVYREYLDANPTQMVANQLGYSARTAARRVQQARAAGLLPQTTPGKRKA